MSGTSLDGLDICVAEFSRSNGNWTYKIISTETISYSEDWKRDLSLAHTLSNEDLDLLDDRLSHYIGSKVADHLKAQQIEHVDLIGSHGHTVLHDPEQGVTLQIGNQASIRKAAGFPVICDFRKQDVELGGQGAPLVPIGDQMLFGDYEMCLNMGGFANLSVEIDGARLAWDICPLNIGINHFASKLGLEMDRNGHIAASNPMDGPLFYKLNQLPYFSLTPPKSLGREWMEQYVYPVLDRLGDVEAISTLSGLASYQIAKTLEELGAQKILCTGGGVHNKHIMSLIKQSISGLLVVPEDELINYKEALIFAFLGLLRQLEEVNVLASVTGASRDHSSGVIYS